MSIVDSVIDWAHDRYVYASSKFRTRQVTPPYLVRELESYGINGLDDLVRRYDTEKLQQMAMRLSWIYSNVNHIAKGVSGADLQVYRGESQEQEIDNDFYKLFRQPNPFFGSSLLLQYTIWALYFDEWGAFWYLNPDPRNQNKIIEIWPIRANRITPVKHKKKFISAYKYRIPGRNDAYEIPAKYVCRFIFPNIFDLFKSMTPLSAASAGVSIYDGLATSQSQLYTEGRGVPLSIVTVDAAVGPADFEIIRQTIQEDWEQGRRIAIAKAGTINAQAVGISNKDLETVASMEANRDEIDSIYMDFPWRSVQNSEGRKESDRLVNSYVIHPLHKLLSSQMEIQVVDPYFGGDLTVGFSDVRKQDVALNIQSRQVNWRAVSFNEARKELNMPEFKSPNFPGLEFIGDLPVGLANNPSFVASLAGISGVRDTGERPDEVGNVEESMDPEMATNQIAENNINVNAAVQKAITDEIKTYRTVCLRAMKRNGTNPGEIDFDTEIIPEKTMVEIQKKIDGIKDPGELRAIFDGYLE